MKKKFDTSQTYSKIDKTSSFLITAGELIRKEVRKKLPFSLTS